MGQALLFLFFLVLLRVVLRRQWLAVGAFLVLFAVLESLGAEYFAIRFAGALVWHALIAVCLVRFGLVAALMALFVKNFFPMFPMTLDFSVWYAGPSFFALLAVLAVVAYAFWTSLGGRPLIGEDALE